MKLHCKSTAVCYKLVCRMTGCSFSVQYLCCLSTSRSSTDKLAFDVGLQENSRGTTIHSFVFFCLFSLSFLPFHASLLFSPYDIKFKQSGDYFMMLFLIIMNIFNLMPNTWVSFWVKWEWTDIRPEKLLLMFLQCTFCYKHRHKNQRAQ